MYCSSMTSPLTRSVHELMKQYLSLQRRYLEQQDRLGSLDEALRTATQGFNPQKRELTEGLLIQMLMNTFFIDRRNLRDSPLFNESRLKEHCRKNPQDIDTILQESVNLRLSLDPFKSWLLLRDYGDSREESLPVLTIQKPHIRLAQRILEVDQSQKKQITDLFRSVIYEEPHGRNFVQNFERWKYESHYEQSDNVVIATYGPSVSGKTTFIEELLKDVCARSSRDVTIQAMMVYFLHDPIKLADEEGRRTRDDGFYEVKLYDLAKPLDRPIRNQYDGDDLSELFKTFTTGDIGNSNRQNFIDFYKNCTKSQRLPPFDLTKFQHGSHINIKTEKEQPEYQNLPFLFKNRGTKDNVKVNCEGSTYPEFAQVTEIDGPTGLEAVPLKDLVHGRQSIPAAAVQYVTDLLQIARYRQTLNNDVSSRSVVVLKIVDPSTSKTVTCVDFFGNEELRTPQMFDLNKVFASESAGIRKTLGILKDVLTFVKKGKVGKRFKLNNMFSKVRLNYEPRLIDSVQQQIKQNLNTFFGLFERQPTITKDFHLIVTGVKDYHGSDDNQFKEMLRNHASMLGFVDKLNGTFRGISVSNEEHLRTIRIIFNLHNFSNKEITANFFRNIEILPYLLDEVDQDGAVPEYKYGKEVVLEGFEYLYPSEVKRPERHEEKPAIKFDWPDNVDEYFAYSGPRAGQQRRDYKIALQGKYEAWFNKYRTTHNPTNIIKTADEWIALKTLEKQGRLKRSDIKKGGKTKGSKKARIKIYSLKYNGKRSDRSYRKTSRNSGRPNTNTTRKRF